MLTIRRRRQDYALTDTCEQSCIHIHTQTTTDARNVYSLLARCHYYRSRDSHNVLTIVGRRQDYALNVVECVHFSVTVVRLSRYKKFISVRNVA
jgi:hypothetical protein